MKLDAFFKSTHLLINSYKLLVIYMKCEIMIFITEIYRKCFILLYKLIVRVVNSKYVMFHRGIDSNIISWNRVILLHGLLFVSFFIRVECLRNQCEMEIRLPGAHIDNKSEQYGSGWDLKLENTISSYFPSKNVSNALKNHVGTIFRTEC